MPTADRSPSAGTERILAASSRSCSILPKGCRLAQWSTGRWSSRHRPASASWSSSAGSCSRFVTGLRGRGGRRRRSWRSTCWPMRATTCGPSASVSAAGARGCRGGRRYQPPAARRGGGEAGRALSSADSPTLAQDQARHHDGLPRAGIHTDLRRGARLVLGIDTDHGMKVAGTSQPIGASDAAVLEPLLPLAEPSDRRIWAPFENDRQDS